MIPNNDMKQHLIKTLKSGVRYDGRKVDEFRNVKVEYGISSNAEGSARVELGGTVVIAGVKLSIEKPYADTADEGMFMVNAELIPLASSRFESGPPSGESIELARVVDRGIREAKAIDMNKLCIEKGEKAWSVSVDIIAMNDRGNLLDAAGIAVLAALKDARLPKVNEDDSIDYSVKTKEKLPMVKDPIPVTVHLIGDQFIVDPTSEEEEFSEARLTVASISDDMLCAMQKGGNKALTIEDIDKMVNIASKKAKELRKKL